MNKLHTRIIVITCRIVVDDLAEDPGIQQRKNLIRRSKQQRDHHELPVIPQIAVERLHYLSVPRGSMPVYSIGNPRFFQTGKPPSSGWTFLTPCRFSRKAARALETSFG